MYIIMMHVSAIKDERLGYQDEANDYGKIRNVMRIDLIVIIIC
jgi:hypothetical protein